MVGIIACAFITLIAVWMIALGVSVEGKSTRCADCGYDLREHQKNGDRCPECGSHIPIDRRTIRRRPVLILAGVAFWFVAMFVVSLILLMGAI